MKFILLTILLISSLSVPASAFPQPKPQYGGGATVGRYVLDDERAKKVSCHYDMVLVERVQKRKAPQDVEDGMLYVPDDDLPRLHLCKVLSVGPGREEENGSVAPNVDNLKPGDLIISKLPWGIGPKDETLSDGTKLSYMRNQDVAALISGGLE
jgi:co-chaperonin GroES (HSP10)